MRNMISDESFRVVWEEIRKKQVFDSKRELKKKGSMVGLLLLLFGGKTLVRSLLLLWNFLCKCLKRTSVQ